MDDVSKRLSAVETGVAEIRGQLPHLASSGELNALRADVNAMETRMATRMHAMEVRMIVWIVGTALSVAGTALAAAKYFSP
jgi:hypothetical protein